MNIQVPAQVAVESFLDNPRYIGANQRYMMLKAVFADVFHQFLKLRHLCNNNTSVHSIRVVGHLAFTHVCLYATLRVVGRYAEVGKVARAYLGINSPEGIDFAKSSAKHTERTETQIVVADE